MARRKRQVNRKHSQQRKKSRTAGHIGSEDSMDVNHFDVGENFTEELEERDTNKMNQEDDGTDDDDNNSNKQRK
eukprot:12100885-Ditylum_brightwellii.AAC.1